MDYGVSLMLKFSPVAVLLLPVVSEQVPSVVDRSAVPITFMVPRLSSSKPCNVEFSALLLCGMEFCAMSLVAGLTTALPCGAEFTVVRLPGFCAELCDDEILEVELAADEF